MTSSLAARLVAEGLSELEADRKAELFERAARVHQTLTRAEVGPHRWFVPGRIEFLGKHTDYAGGPSLVCAVERGFCVVASPRTDRIIRIADATTSEAARPVCLDPEGSGVAGDWTAYPKAVARRVARNFPGHLRGVDISFASDLPRAAGLSSSSALITAIFVVLSDVNNLRERQEYAGNIGCPEDLAGYLGSVESGQSFGTLAGDEGVGTFGGSEDHAAIVCGRAGHLGLYTFCPVRGEAVVAIPEGHTFAVGASGIAAEKTGRAREKYNRASLAAATILKMWHDETGRADPTLREAATYAGDAPQQISDVLRRSKDERFGSQALLDRFDHFMEESQRIVPAATSALRDGELALLGRIVDDSQAAAERLLGNQTPETIELARLARAYGAVAASAFGAGFGGSVWALVRRSDAQTFCRTWEASYHRRFPSLSGASEFFISAAAPALIRV